MCTYWGLIFMQNVTIMGIPLQERSLEESRKAADRFLRNGALDMVVFASADMLLRSEREPEIRDLIESAAMVFWAEPEVLAVMGITDSELEDQIRRRSFLRQMLSQIAQNGGEVALAGFSEEDISRLRAEIDNVQPGLSYIHYEILESADGQIPEAAINAINTHAPTLVVSRMDYVHLQRWLARSGRMINVGIWLAIPPGMELAEDREKGIVNRIRRAVRMRVLKHTVKTMEG